MAGKGTGVTVFVDDAVTGHLPAVCAKSGAPMDGLMTIRTEVGGGTRLGVLWLLVLVGPLGWLALLVLYGVLGNGGGEILTVQLPWTEKMKAGYEDAVRRRRTAMIWATALPIVAVGTLYYLESDVLRDWFSTTALFVVVVLVLPSLIAAHAAHKAAEATTVRVKLDASRRWVTLSGVHPNFAEAVEASRRGKHTPMP